MQESEVGRPLHTTYHLPRASAPVCRIPSAAYYAAGFSPKISIARCRLRRRFSSSERVTWVPFS